jgi:dUTP pyrophosphatase
MSMVQVAITRLKHGEGLPLPDYASTGSAGLDLRAATPADQPILMPPGERRAIGTGVAIALPSGYEAQVRPRSGLALEHGITCLNSPGTIDSDYRGEIKVILINLGQTSFTVRRGDRIAQLVIAPVAQAQWHERATLDQTLRGGSGFGSSGSR